MISQGENLENLGPNAPPPSPKLFRRFPLLITHKVGLLDMDMGPVWYSFSSGWLLPFFKLRLKPSPSVQTSQERLREYFTQFGEIDDVLIMKDPITQVDNHSSLRLIFSVWWQFQIWYLNFALISCWFFYFRLRSYEVTKNFTCVDTQVIVLDKLYWLWNVFLWTGDL